MTKKTLEEVEKFWNENPLFFGESDHKKAYINDVFYGSLPAEIFIPESIKNKKVLDLGCGIGFWTIEIQKNA